MKTLFGGRATLGPPNHPPPGKFGVEDEDDLPPPPPPLERAVTGTDIPPAPPPRPGVSPEPKMLPPDPSPAGPQVVQLDEIPSLTREQLASLLPVLPLLLDWLRHASDNSADLFMQSKEQDYIGVAFGLSELIQTLQRQNQDQPHNSRGSVDAGGHISLESQTDVTLSFNQVKALCSKYPISMWSNAVRLVLTQSSPTLIPAELGSELVGMIPRLSQATSVTEVCHTLGPLLDKLPRSHFETLGEFCAMVRDTSTSVTLIACLVGPQILLPNLLLFSEPTQGKGALSAAAVMELIIMESESLFGRCAATRAEAPFGDVNRYMLKKQNQITSAKLDFKAAMMDPSQKVIKDSLRAFYDWRDPTRSASVDFLFERLPVIRIAEGLQMRYGLVPPGWSVVVHVIRQQQVHGNHVSNATSITDSVGSTVNDDNSFTNEDMIRIANNATKDDSPAAFIESETVGFIVDEIIDSERKYFNTLNAFVQAYCEKIEKIAEGQEGDLERAELGLATPDIELIFGNKIRNIRDASGVLAGELAVIQDFKGVAGSRGRVGLVIDAFKKSLKDLEVIGPYMATYRNMLDLLNKKTSEVQAKRAKKKRKIKAQNFLEIWQLERVKHENLKLAPIETILIKPIQKIPHYKLFINELQKKVDDNHPCKKELDDLYDAIVKLGKSFDEQVSPS